MQQEIEQRRAERLQRQGMFAATNTRRVRCFLDFSSTVYAEEQGRDERMMHRDEFQSSFMTDGKVVDFSAVVCVLVAVATARY